MSKANSYTTENNHLDARVRDAKRGVKAVALMAIIFEFLLLYALFSRYRDQAITPDGSYEVAGLLGAGAVLMVVIIFVALVFNDRILMLVENTRIRNRIIVSMQQGDVDAQMRLFAERFFKETNEQGRLETEYSQDLDVKDALRLTRNRVRALKDEFWYAHSTFVTLGFKVRKSFKEYLPEESSGVTDAL
jgi:hypothetical protein